MVVFIAGYGTKEMVVLSGNLCVSDFLFTWKR